MDGTFSGILTFDFLSYKCINRYSQFHTKEKFRQHFHTIDMGNRMIVRTLTRIVYKEI